MFAVWVSPLRRREQKGAVYTYYHVWSMWLQRNVFCLSCQESARGCGLQEFHLVCVFVHSGQKCGKLWRNKKHQNVVNFQCASNICISTWKVISDLGKIEKKILNKGRGYTYLNLNLNFDNCVHTKMEMNLTWKDLTGLNIS